MEEHIESVGADSEGIVKVNFRVLLYAFLFVVGALCAAVAAALHWEPVGLRAARVLSGRWSVCDEMCEAAAPPETPHRTGGDFPGGYGVAEWNTFETNTRHAID